ncbi:MAG: hypothetical protein K2G83_05795, partial [Ruminococcus sp.]|nr:hypothetical protein [Ruminococcus sp.]
ALMILTAFASCGDSPENNSELSDSVSESATEELTESETPKEEITLDSKWECKYLKIAKSSEWEEDIKIEDDDVNVYWDWYDDSPHMIAILLGKSISGKMSQEDLRICYTGLEYDDYKILDSFEKNGQAYIIMGDSESENRDLMFSTDTVDGTIYYSVEDEELVMKMIDSIEFY